MADTEQTKVLSRLLNFLFQFLSSFAKGFRSAKPGLYKFFHCDSVKCFFILTGHTQHAPVNVILTRSQIVTGKVRDDL